MGNGLGIGFLEALANDLRYAARTLRKSPGSTAVAILTLALGIGANSAIFSILDPLLVQNLTVQRPEELVRVDAAGSIGNAGAWEAFAYQRLRDDSPAFSGMMAFVRASLDNVGHDRRSSSVQAEIVSGNYFGVLGLPPFAGRLTFEEGDLGNTVVLGFEYWRREFHGDKAALGQTLLAQGRALTIVGITPPEFSGMQVGEYADIYVPISAGSVLGGSNGPALHWVIAIGRLRPGVSPAQALEVSRPVFEQIKRESQIPAVEQHQEMDHLVLTSAAQGLSAVRSRFSLPGRVLMGVAALVLLIACSNVAHLLLAQGSSRRREMAVRLAIGAQRRHLVRQALMEGAVLASIGAAAGLLVARWTSRVIVAALSDTQTHVVLSTPLSGRVLLFTLVITMLAVLLSVMAPALWATRVDASEDIRMRAAGGPREVTSRLSSALVVAQVAMSVAALAAGGLLVHSLFNLQTMDVGFDRDRILAADLNGDAAGHTSEQVKLFYDRLLDGARSLPGVRSAAISSFAPVSGRMLGINLRVDGYTARPGEEPKAFLAAVTPGYFTTLGIGMLQGRDFTRLDSPLSPRVAIINLSTARHYFAGRAPVGQRLQFVEGGRIVEIIGVVADSKYNDLREGTTDFVYLDSLQSSPPAVVGGTLTVSAAGGLTSLRTEIPELIGSLDASVHATRIATLGERIDESLHAERLIAALCGAFSLLALFLTGVGLYGILAFNVVRRTSEIGIRVALGAKRADIFRLVVGHGLKLVLWGLLLGSAAALASMNLLGSMLFGVRSGDPATFVAVCLLLAGASALACYIPARRATRVDPLVALRNE